MSGTYSLRVPKDKPHLEWVLENLPCSFSEFIIPILEKHLSLEDEAFQNKMVKYHQNKAKEYEKLNNYKIALEQIKKREVEKALTDERLLKYFKFYHERLHPTKIHMNKKESDKWLSEVWKNIIKDTKTKLTPDDFKQAYHDHLEKEWLEE